MSAKLSSLFLFVAACSLAYAQDAAVAPRFAIETTTELRRDCLLPALDVGSDLVEIRQEEQPLPPFPIRDFVLLSNGDRLPLDSEAPATLQENRLLVWPDKSLPGLHQQGLRLYLPYVVLVFWTLPQGVDDADLFFAKLAQESRKRDVLYLQNGDRIEGTVAALAPRKGCVIASGQRKVEVPWSQFAGIAWNTDRQARLRARSLDYHAVWQGGARLSYSKLTYDGTMQRWLGKTQLGPTLAMPAAALLALAVRHGPAVALSDLTPSRAEQPPYLGISWPLRKDANVAGLPLRLGSSTYEKGLGMHAPCRVTYALQGKYQRFTSFAGLDARRAQHGRVRLAVELDGKRMELNDGKEMTSTQPPLAVRLDVRGVNFLTLIAETASFGDVQAEVNWANALLLKKDR